MPESQPKVPQAGLDFIREMILDDDGVDIREVRGPVYHSGECAVEKIGKRGAHICEFVIEPGPEAKRIVLSQQAGPQHPIVATVHNAVEYREIPHSLDPHHHKFALEGEALTPHDAVTAILQLADLSW